jgi:peptide/nickel transport system substrate-binding protein
MSATPRAPRRLAAACAFVLTAFLALSACGGSSTHAQGSKAKTTLTVGISNNPATLDPALHSGQPTVTWVNELAYEPLVIFANDGTYQPGLATRWGFVGNGNQNFELTVRKDVKFADGTAVDAKAVAASLTYAFGTKGQTRVLRPRNPQVEATGPLTVSINCNEACPDMPLILSQNIGIGSIISPAGLAHPDKLGTNTFGAGAYVLNQQQSVVGESYVYDANPKYWNAKGRNFQHVIVRVIPDDNARIASLNSGQVDIIDNVPPAAAKSVQNSGASIVKQDSGFFAMIFKDRTGKPLPTDPQGAVHSPPLGDVRVRQALNYAVDRATIAKQLGQGFATPADSMTYVGSGAFDPGIKNQYPYNPEKAKKLLTDAGYPNGFTLDVITLQYNQTEVWAQATINYWEKVGIKVNLDVEKAIPSYVQNVIKYPVTATQYGGSSFPFSMQARYYYPDPPNPSIFNAFITEPSITAQLQKAAAAPASDAAQIYREVNKETVDQAFGVPVAYLPFLFGVSKHVTLPAAPSNVRPGQLVNAVPMLSEAAPAT